MFEDFIQRENLIFETLQHFLKERLFFIVVGGYGVSAYKHRFSVDADIIIRKNDCSLFEEVLQQKRFIKKTAKILDHVYASEFIRYQTKEKLPVSIDMLIDGIGSRTTQASFSIQELEKYSQIRKIIGREKEVHVFVPDKEILIVLKLHSGRGTDFRDIVALSKDIDIEIIKKLLWRGNTALVTENIKKLFSLLEKKEFIDSFKGVFIEKKYDIDTKNLNKLKELLE